MRISRVLLVITLSLGAGWLAMQLQQWLFRVRAQALLADIKSLEVNRSSWSDAQRLMIRWGKWGGWYGNCNAEECSYSIRICHLCLISPSFVMEDGPHFATRLFELVGLRSSGAIASFHVTHGIVTEKAFGLEVTLPVSHWLRPGDHFWLTDEIGDTYWPSLAVASSENVKILSTPFAVAEHPDRSITQRRIRLVASFTPEESREEKIALTDFHFDCITRWTPCTNRGELLPRAEAEYEAERGQ
jgi:hypothetical protein